MKRNVPSPFPFNSFWYCRYTLKHAKCIARESAPSNQQLMRSGIHAPFQSITGGDRHEYFQFPLSLGYANGGVNRELRVPRLEILIMNRQSCSHSGQRVEECFL